MDVVALGLAKAAIKRQSTADRAAQGAPRALGRFTAQMAMRQYRRASMITLGSSTTAGVNAGSGQGYVDLLQAGLRLDYPVTGVVGGRWVAAQDATWTTGGTVAASATGLGRASRALSAAATLTRTDTCTGWEIHYAQGPGAGAFTVAIDGAAAATVTPDTTGAVRHDGIYRTAESAAGSHTLLITATGAVTINGVYAEDGDRATGVRIYNSGLSGSYASLWDATPSFFERVEKLQPACVSIMLGSNEYSAQDNPATWRTQVESVINKILLAAPYTCVWLVGTYPRQDVTSPTYEWAEYLAVLRDIAAANPQVAYTGLADAFLVTGLAGGDPLGILNPDLIHMGNAGHAFMADLLLRTLRAPAPIGDLSEVWGVAPQPLDEMASLVARWRADDLTGVDGSTVASIPARAGAVSTAMAMFASPTLVASAVGGKKAVRFVAASSQYAEVDIPDQTMPCTVVAVFDLRTNGGRVFTSNASGGYMQLLSASATSLAMNAHTDTSGFGASGWSPSAGFRIDICVFDENAARFYEHRRTPARDTMTNGATAILGRLRVARSVATTYSDMDLAEIALIDRAITDREAQVLLTELAGFYGLTLGA